MQIKFKIDLNQFVIYPDYKDRPSQLIEEIADKNLVCANCGLVLKNRLINLYSK